MVQNKCFILSSSYFEHSNELKVQACKPWSRMEWPKTQKSAEFELFVKNTDSRLKLAEA